MWTLENPHIAILWKTAKWASLTPSNRYPEAFQIPNSSAVAKSPGRCQFQELLGHPPARKLFFCWLVFYAPFECHIHICLKTKSAESQVFAKYVDPPAWSQPDPKIWGASILNHHQLVISNAKKQMPGSDSSGSTETSLPKPMELSL